jgi:hypothetical protein
MALMAKIIFKPFPPPVPEVHMDGRRCPLARPAALNWAISMRPS